MKKLLAVCLLYAASCFGQQSCPVEIKKVNPRALPFSSGLMGAAKDPWDSYIQIEYTNTSLKTIIAIKFGVYFVDGMNEAQKSVYSYQAEEKVSPGQTKKPYWGDGVYEHEYGRSMRAMAWTQKIMFADGTYWIDDGSQSCGSVRFAPQIQASPNGSITTITTDPPGATVTIDDKVGPPTPSRFVLLKKGDAERTITISLKGYKTVEKKFVPDGKPIVLEIKLEKEEAF